MSGCSHCVLTAYGETEHELSVLAACLVWGILTRPAVFFYAIGSISSAGRALDF